MNVPQKNKWPIIFNDLTDNDFCWVKLNIYDTKIE